MTSRTTLRSLTLLLSWLLWSAIILPAAAGTINEHSAVPSPSSFKPPVPYLGKHPELPDQPELRPSAPLQISPQTTTGLTVTTASREQSRNFFNALYPASETAPIDWTGNLATCSAGTTAASFKDAVQLRVNYFRAMAGVPAAITFSDLFSAKNQLAALMMSRNDMLSHYPPDSWYCYTSDGYEAAGKSNLALGFFGAGAVSGYVLDHGDNNAAAGHRRWLLYPQTQVMGTGDIPDTTEDNSANSLWVFDGNYGSPRPVARDDFVAWPPPGYVPHQVVYPRWSLSYPGANFSNATVSMTRNGVTLPVRLEPLTTNVGENSLVWVPDNLDTNSANSFPRPAADTPYAVTVNNVLIGGTLHNYAYTVTLFDPRIPGADHVSADVTGPVSPAVGTATPYSITPVPGTDSYQWRYAGTAATPVFGAENGISGISVSAPPGYSPISTTVHATGSASYHLTHPDFVDQTLTLDPTLLPDRLATLSFQSRLGIATAAQTATVEISTDDGSTWQEVYRQTGSGNPGETTFTSRTINLAPFADRTIRVRFVYRYTMGEPAYTQTTTGFGWYLDDIIFTDSRELSGTTAFPTTPTPTFVFTPPAEGNLILQARPLLYNRYPLEWGPVLRVTASASSLLSLACTISGTGGGKVMSNPEGISCPYEICTFLFPSYSPVSLTAYPDTNSLFGGWSGGGCGGTGDCSVPMTSATSVNARFDYVLPVRVPLAAPPGFSSLTLAYDAVPDGGAIMARAFIFAEDLLLDVNKRVFLRGGYTTGFSSSIGVSVLNGCLTVSKGTLVVAGVVVR